MSSSRSSLGALCLGAVGVVYGDIGTSPLYAFKEVFASGHVAVTPDNILGILSLIFWTLTIVVSVKYVGLVMRADNHGEGGLMALLALASHSVRDRPQVRRVLMVCGIFGLALFFGDGVITPAISVLSAVEGLEIVTPAAKPYVLPISFAVLGALFLAQKHGTARIGRYFGPIMVLWFLAIALCGLVPVLRNPSVLWALSPHHALRFGLANLPLAFVLLGAVFLCVTGAEALYADMGHFGKAPIQSAWFALVMPALVLNYFGQGALVLADPKAIENPFFLMTPTWALMGMVGLATAATVIASQALISGAFSATKQTIQLGYLPRMTILHTSEHDKGQIYVPAVNLALLVGVVLAVAMFHSSSALAAAYGISVSLVMVITTAMTFFVIRYGWGYPLPLCIAATGFFLVVDTVFFASNLLKIADGGWFPLLLAAALYIILATWSDGRAILSDKQRAEALDLKTFLESVVSHPPTRVPGTAVFLTAQSETVPNALLHNLKHNKVLHERNLFVTVRTHEVPRLEPDQRGEIAPICPGCWRVALDFGFMQSPDVPEALRHVTHGHFELDSMTTSYFLSRDIVVPTVGDGMADWREKIFAAMHSSASAAAEYLYLPNNSVVELGSKVEI
ncbi:KUP system potassium uptake protein [Variovorax sp. HW608]|uniref:potassium transporter Kup n=1 Tax=Variovorax sp. HW608 TaxID=1034889 RepID=UPI000820141D|nr:potassium transporter Kup [Variovorax sp. HW608]SCK26323.1 KUP system potassium uptake protein [Variovorax sp. HW608]